MDNISNPAIILIADSSETLFNSLRDAFETTDYAFVYARNGEEAIRLHDLLKSEIELAIIELELPAQSGFEVIDQFTRRGRRYGIVRTRRVIHHETRDEKSRRGNAFGGVNAAAASTATPTSTNRR